MGNRPKAPTQRQVVDRLEKAQRRTIKKIKDADLSKEGGMEDFIYNVVALAAIKFTTTTILMEDDK